MAIILLIGKDGQIGHALQRTLQPLGRVVAVGRDRVDLTHPDTIRRTIQQVTPDVVVNAAAYTAVDRAETEIALAETVNAQAPGVLAEATDRAGAWLIHYSTDYVFDGTRRRPYTENDKPNPINVYGRTKLAGERAIQQVGGAHLILRTSWVYSARRSNFLRTMLRLADERHELRVIDDQTGAPTWAGWVAEATAQMLRHVTRHPTSEAPRGVFHLTSAGATTWYGFARAIFDGFDVDAVDLTPISTEAYGAPAPRPRYSVLSCHRAADTFDLSIPHWRDQLQTARTRMLDPDTSTPTPNAGL